MEITPNVNVNRDAKGAFFACAGCGQPLGDIGENYKLHCLQEELPIEASNPLIGDPALIVDNAVTFRMFYCPGCGTLLDNEATVDHAPPNHDIDLRLPSTG